MRRLRFSSAPDDPADGLSQEVPLVALGPDSTLQTARHLGRSHPDRAAGQEPWLMAELEPTFDCPADRLLDVAELFYLGAIPPAAMDLYSPRTADRIRGLLSALRSVSDVRAPAAARA